MRIFRQRFAFLLVLVAVFLLAVTAPSASADAIITFTLQGTASGTLVDNGVSVPFSNAPYSFSVVTETNLIQTSGSNPPGGTFYFTPWVSGPTGGTVSVDGVTGTWLNGLGVYNYIYPPNPSASSLLFTEQLSPSSYFFFTFGYNASLLSYSLQSAIGPLLLTFTSPGVNFPDPVTTSFGSFTLTSLGSETFTAVTTTATPEPSVLLLAGTGTLVLALAALRKRWRAKY